MGFGFRENAIGGVGLTLSAGFGGLARAAQGRILFSFLFLFD